MLKRPLLALSLLACPASLAGCDDLAARALGGAMVAAQGLFISEADEVRIGQQTTAKVLARMPEYPNPDVRAYVDGIGQKLAARSERKNLPYSFRVLDAKDPNAFAAPGGFIFVTTGALRLMKNEAELAGVLGHEVAHVDKRHSIKSIQQALVAQGLATAAVGGSGQMVELAATIGANLILKGLDRGAELEADRVGARFAYDTGYDPRSLGGFLDTLRQTTGDVPGWLVPMGDHPRTDDRLTQLDAYFMSEGLGSAGKAVGSAEFKAQVLDRLGPAAAPASQ